MKFFRQFLMPAGAIAFAASLFLAALFAVRLITLPPGSFFQRTSVMQTIYLVLCLTAMLLISRGRLAEFGFTRGTFRFSPRILWWLLPVAVFSILGAPASPHSHSFIDMTKTQTIVFIWLYSSFCEETLVRGLLQTLLSRSSEAGAVVRRGLSMPVVVSGLFFGAMHLTLIRLIGPGAIPIVLAATYLGLVAAYYREKTGSLLPAYILHVLFNIAGTLPMWLILGLHSGR
jgi:membrane protease YdiL (CAAX protease family)